MFLLCILPWLAGGAAVIGGIGLIGTGISQKRNQPPIVEDTVVVEEPSSVVNQSSQNSQSSNFVLPD